MELRIRIYHSFVILSNIFKTAVKKKKKKRRLNAKILEKKGEEKKKRKKKVSLPIYVVRSASKILLFFLYKKRLKPWATGRVKIHLL